MIKLDGLALTLALLGAGAAAAPADEVLAVKAAKIVTVAGPEIEHGVVLVKDGKIDAVGPADRVEIPAGARVIEAPDGVVLPGLVNPYSRLGLFGRARGFGRPGRAFSNKSDTNPTAELFVRQPVFKEIREAGVTTYGLIPGTGGGITGTVSVLRPAGQTPDEMVLKEGVLLRIAFGGGSGAKSGLKTLLDRAKSEAEKIEKAKKRRADWEKRQAARRKKEAARRKKKGSAAAGDGATKKPKSTKAAPKGPKVPEMKANLKNIVAARSRKLRVLLEIATPANLDHFFDALKDRHELDFILVTTGRTAVEVKERLKEKKIPVLIAPELATERDTTVRINPAAILERAGIEFALRPGQDRVSALKGLFFQLGTLVKCGLSRAAALRAVTLTPARWLGVDRQVGSLEKGKAANLLVFDGDPLASPVARLQHVVLDGKIVFEADHGTAKEFKR